MRRNAASSVSGPWQNTSLWRVSTQESAVYDASRRRRILQPQQVVGYSGPTKYTGDANRCWLDVRVPTTALGPPCREPRSSERCHSPTASLVGPACALGVLISP